MMQYWVAFTIGLFGSLHCVGMCGPIALALPLTAKEKTKVVFQSLLYHLGRTTTYALMGAFMGFMGWGVLLAGYQKVFSIILGISFILIALFSISVEQQLIRNATYKKGLTWVQHKLSSLLAIKNNSNAYKIGLVNGLLPCGLVYIALASSVTHGGLLQGGLYMAAFGMGTIPLMLGVTVFGKYGKTHLAKFRKWIPYALVLLGFFLIQRGLMLQIPLELEFWEVGNFPIMCH